MLLQIYEHVRVRRSLYSCAHLINRMHILVDYIINDKCKPRGFRLNATSRIPSLSALFTSRLLGRDRTDVSFASREIYRGTFITHSDTGYCWRVIGLKYQPLRITSHLHEKSSFPFPGTFPPKTADRVASRHSVRY